MAARISLGEDRFGGEDQFCEEDRSATGSRNPSGPVFYLISGSFFFSGPTDRTNIAKKLYLVVAMLASLAAMFASLARLVLCRTS